MKEGRIEEVELVVLTFIVGELLLQFIDALDVVASEAVPHTLFTEGADALLQN